MGSENIIEMESKEIFDKFYSIKKRAEESKKDKKKKSIKKFLGHIFRYLLFAKIKEKEYIPKQYTLVEGPLYIRGIEWIEWDGAIVIGKKKVDSYYDSDDIIALFEIKSGGIYGDSGGKKHLRGEEAVRESLKKIKKRFMEAKKQNLEIKCIYITLWERTPMNHEKSILYYDLTKEILNDDNSGFLAFALYKSINKDPEPYRNVWRGEKGIARSIQELFQNQDK